MWFLTGSDRQNLWGEECLVCDERGSGIGGADIYNRKLSEKKGLKHMGTAQIIMPENYIAMFNAPDVEKAKKIVAAGGPDIAKAVLAIKHGEKLPSKSGLGASFESGLVNDIFYAAFVKANAFRRIRHVPAVANVKNSVR